MDVNLAETTQQLSAFWAAIWTWAVTFLPRFGTAILILAVGFFLARWVSRMVRAAIYRTRHIDSTLGPILGTTVRYAVIILFAIAALGQLGVQTTSLLAVLGAAGLAVGLALQGTLQNIAADIMLIYLRPFRSGDTIETPAINGKVREIGLFVTYLDTPDGLFYFVPNSSLWNVPLKNHTRNGRRLATVLVNVGYESDLAEVRRVLEDLARSQAGVLSEPAPAVTVETYLDNRIAVSLKAWTSTVNHATVQRALAEQAKGRLQAAGIKVPT